MNKKTGTDPGIEIIGAESMGVRSLCCVVNTPSRRIVIDPGVALGYVRSGLLPHPFQVAIGRRVRRKILQSLKGATDVVLSHYHGDHVPLAEANPYQLSIRDLPDTFRQLSCWCKSGDDLSTNMRKRFDALADLMGNKMQIAEGRSEGDMAFSPSVPHGAAGGNMGTVMMTRIEVAHRVFVHASDIQLLDPPTVDRVIDWRPDVLLAAGPPLYLSRLSDVQRHTAWENALRLAQAIDVLILDHHLMRSEDGAVWLDALGAATGKKIFCAADYMGLPRQLLEAQRADLYQKMPVSPGWHDIYAQTIPH
jgi:predicted metallo-beta-lactamase superfamily hydrolase